ncbi:hypothetical protein EVAR_36856_1 [Eumeta japonica]|uniref:Uncharacterized protein n=1 Tax=Eumeta variegata TaxID=151549 RepID=A0A4C1WSM9_EUMVA|nr:hypothetical protein EVAR_36856_1 [Eumeta japonica]
MQTEDKEDNDLVNDHPKAKINEKNRNGLRAAPAHAPVANLIMKGPPLVYCRDNVNKYANFSASSIQMNLCGSLKFGAKPSLVARRVPPQPCAPTATSDVYFDKY